MTYNSEASRTLFIFRPVIGGDFSLIFSSFLSASLKPRGHLEVCMYFRGKVSDYNRQDPFDSPLNKPLWDIFELPEL